MTTSSDGGHRNVSIRVLGPTRLCVNGADIAMSPLRRRTLAALVLGDQPGASAEQLIALIWPSMPPRTARASLLNQLSWLRRQLPNGALTLRHERYQIAPCSVRVDVAALQDAACQLAHQTDQPGIRFAMAHGEPLPPIEPYDLPFADLDGGHPPVARARAAIATAHARLGQARAHQLLLTGRIEEAVTALEALLAHHPDHEPAWEALMRALAQAGRRIEALAAYHRAYRTFVEQHGLDVPTSLGRLHQAVLDNDERPRCQTAARAVPRTAMLSGLEASVTSASTALLGPPGSGRSTLVGQLAARWALGRGPIVRAVAQPSAAALQPIRALLDAIRARRNLTLGGTRDEEPAATLRAAVEQALQRHGAVTLVLDDADQAGPATQHLLARMAASMPQLRLLLVAHDLDELHPELARQLAVIRAAPLSVAELERWLWGATPDGFAGRSRSRFAPLAGWVHHQTGGLASLATALADAVLDPDGLDPDMLVRDPDGRPLPPSGAPPTPASCTAMLVAILDALPVDTRRWVDAAAVLSEHIDPRFVDRIVGPASLRQAVRAGIVTDAHACLRFASPLVHRIVARAVDVSWRIEVEAVAAELRVHHVLAAQPASAMATRGAA